MNTFKFQLFPKVADNHSTGLLPIQELAYLCKGDAVRNNVLKFRETHDTKFKKSIYSFTPMGVCTDQANPVRTMQTMKPTGLVMIDLDKMNMTYDELRKWVAEWMNENNMYIQSLNTVMVYITCSGTGLRVIFPRFAQTGILESAYLYCINTHLPIMYLDKQCTDYSRLSILTLWEDILYVRDPVTDTDDTILLNPEPSADERKKLSDLGVGEPAATPQPDEDSPSITPVLTDSENKPFKKYTEKDIIENDKMYAEYKYKGRLVCQIVDSYISWKTKGMGAERGERHSLYNLLCKNFRNLCDNDPRILHAVLPSLGHPFAESWKQVTYHCAVNRSPLLPKDFYFWMQGRGFLDYATEETGEDVLPEDEKFYKWAIANMPPLPPILREVVNTAPYWFKLPILSVMESYLGLLATNYRSHYIDGFPISLSGYNIVYAPQGSGKSMSRRVSFLIEQENKRDKLALMKAQLYDAKVKKKNGSGENPDEPKWKQRIFAAKTSLGEIMKRQEAIGDHHWLQDVSEFSIWAAVIKKNKEEWSAFFRTSYDNEEFSQSFQSSNSYRGRHKVYPLLHARCTVGQIYDFFTNVEDGLLSRFDFMPLLGQRFADFQPWKTLSDKAQREIEKVIDRLHAETYVDDVCSKDLSSIKSADLNDKSVWDYEMKDPFDVDLSFLYEPLHQWQLEKIEEAKKSNNDSLDTFRRRCGRKGFQFALLCRALYGRCDKNVQKKLIALMRWRAEVSLFFMRYLWEEKLNSVFEKSENHKKGFRMSNVFDKLPDTFTAAQLAQTMSEQGYKTPAHKLVRLWTESKLIKEIAKKTYKKNK